MAAKDKKKKWHPESQQPAASTPLFGNAYEKGGVTIELVSEAEFYAKYPKWHRDGSMTGFDFYEAGHMVEKIGWGRYVGVADDPGWFAENGYHTV